MTDGKSENVLFTLENYMQFQSSSQGAISNKAFILLINSDPKHSPRPCLIKVKIAHVLHIAL